ncbi:transferase [Ascochyta rabiei]|uniref:Dynactin subunit 6 n=1 Tax=Didymella rabiei TaxID=5454 RepID=A0A163M8E2_DIDRA|nr:transferase [Ascochyta rabiei]
MAARDPRRTSTAPKRTSLLPRPSSIAVDPTALIAQHAQLTGTHPITIGPGAVLHPHSKLNSTGCVVMLGEGCVVFERARVGLADVDAPRPESSRRTSGTSAGGRGDGVVLGRNVTVEANAVVEAAEVGEGTLIDVAAVVGRGAVIGKVGSLLFFSVADASSETSTDSPQHCTISAASVVPPYTTLPDYTVVFAGSQKRVDKTLQQRPDLREAKMAVHKKQLDMFRRLMANNIAKWTG